jgi:hypothetical protein
MMETQEERVQEETLFEHDETAVASVADAIVVVHARGKGEIPPYITSGEVWAYLKEEKHLNFPVWFVYGVIKTLEYSPANFTIKDIGEGFFTVS